MQTQRAIASEPVCMAEEARQTRLKKLDPDAVRCKPSAVSKPEQGRHSAFRLLVCKIVGEASSHYHDLSPACLPHKSLAKGQQKSSRPPPAADRRQEKKQPSARSKEPGIFVCGAARCRFSPSQVSCFRCESPSIFVIILLSKRSVRKLTSTSIFSILSRSGCSWGASDSSKEWPTRTGRADETRPRARQDEESLEQSRRGT